jgi:hypothetical protein
MRHNDTVTHSILKFTCPQNNFERFEVFLFLANLLHAKETFHTAIYKAAKHRPSISIIPSDELELVEPYVTTPP